jgi:hypothetical protein
MMHLAQDGDQWGGSLNTLMKLGVPQEMGNFSTE